MKEKDVKEDWEKILRKFSVSENPYLESQVIRMLKKMKKLGGYLLDEEQKELPMEVIIEAIDKGYTEVWFAPPGCPSELDRLVITKKGEKYTVEVSP